MSKNTKRGLKKGHILLQEGKKENLLLFDSQEVPSRLSGKGRLEAR